MRLCPPASIGPFHSSFVAHVPVQWAVRVPTAVAGGVIGVTLARVLAQFLAQSNARNTSSSPSQLACSAQLANNRQSLAQGFCNNSIERWLREGAGEHRATSQSSAPEPNCLGTKALFSSTPRIFQRTVPGVEGANAGNSLMAPRGASGHHKTALTDTRRPSGGRGSHGELMSPRGTTQEAPGDTRHTTPLQGPPRPGRCSGTRLRRPKTSLIRFSRN